MSYRTVQVDNLLDLTQRKVRRQLGVTLRDITSNDYSLTRAIGDWSRAQGYNGIIAPSARHQGGVRWTMPDSRPATVAERQEVVPRIVSGLEELVGNEVDLAPGGPGGALSQG